MPKSQKCSRVSVEKTAFLRALRCVLCAVHCVAVSKSNKHSRTHITGTLHVHTCLIGDSITWRPRGRTSTSSAGRHMTLAHCTRGERDLCIVVPAPMQRRTTTRRWRRSWRRRLEAEVGAKPVAEKCMLCYGCSRKNSQVHQAACHWANKRFPTDCLIPLNGAACLPPSSSGDFFSALRGVAPP